MLADAFPLFPLQTNLLPTEKLRLRIFEARYLDMVRRCLKQESEFGVVKIVRGSEVGLAETVATGTAASIMDWAQLDGGLLGLAIIGSKRFDVLETRRQSDGLYVAEIRWRADEDSLPSSDAEWISSLFESASNGNSLPAPTTLIWILAARLPLSPDQRQMLLESETPAARCELLRALWPDKVPDLTPSGTGSLN